MEATTADAGPIAVQGASFTLETRPLHFEARVEVTSKGLLAIAALVSSILLATAVVVRAAASRR